MALDFGKTKSKAMVDNVMKKVDDTELDNKKRDIPLDLIDVNPDNESIFGYEDIEHLASRIEENGFFGAIEVYAKKDGRYEISSGHRRYLACKFLGREKIPCIIMADVDDRDKAKHLIEGNIHNRKMTPYITAKAIEYYDTHVLKQENQNTRRNFDKLEYIAKVFNISRASVGRYLAILKLIPELQELTKKENAPYLNIVGLANLSKEDQKKVYQDLKKTAGQDDITSLSKTTINQVANRYREKANEKTKKSNLRQKTKDNRISILEEDPEEVKYYQTPSTTIINYEEDDEEIIDNKILGEETSIKDDTIPIIETKSQKTNDAYLKMTYYLKLMNDIDISIENWSEENRQSIKEQLIKLADKL